MRPWQILLMVLLLLQEFVSAQNFYWVQLKDKEGTPYQISHPEAFLSQRSIDRRVRQHIAIDETDLPVSSLYLDSLQKLGLEIFHTSKWLNGVTVRISNPSLVEKISALSFVKSIELTRPENTLKSANRKFSDELISEASQSDYGLSIDQLTQLNGQYLHDQGYRGRGVLIAVLDAGFWHVDQIAAFDSLRNSNRIMGIRDLVNPYSDFYEQYTHGMSVLSCMAANLPGTLIGTAPDASYYLLRTEEISTEYLIEEDNWVAGAEYADSIGVDVINSSLGYFTFNDPSMNHTYSDMDGKTTRVTQGANMAFQKGILVFSSAGNEAGYQWKRIIAPSDGENVIGVAAVDAGGKYASFSSVGPAFGGAVKPNVAARGSSTYLIDSSGNPGTSNGTSFSSPVLAGMGACLLQANPYANVKQLKMAIEQSASQYSHPDSLLGYGIPDFEIADKYLKANLVAHQNQETSWMISPNPFSNYLFIRNINPVSSDKCQVRIFNLQGVCIYQSGFNVSETYLLKNLGNLPDGFLILAIHSGDREERFKLLKAEH
jgi:serine protease AprX